MLICVDEAYVRKIAVEANELVSSGVKLPISLISTAPQEYQPQPPTGKLSKTQKKKLKKKAKLQNELIKKQMEHLQQLEQSEKGTNENENEVDEDSEDTTKPSIDGNESLTKNSNTNLNEPNDDLDKSNESDKNDGEGENGNVSESENVPTTKENSDANVSIDSENTPSSTKGKSKKAISPLDPAFDLCDFDVKIADLGNACWVDRHFTEGNLIALICE